LTRLRRRALPPPNAASQFWTAGSDNDNGKFRYRMSAAPDGLLIDRVAPREVERWRIRLR